MSWQKSMQRFEYMRLISIIIVPIYNIILPYMGVLFVPLGQGY